jgi:hypothetical protein
MSIFFFKKKRKKRNENQKDRESGTRNGAFGCSETEQAKEIVMKNAIFFLSFLCFPFSQRSNNRRSLQNLNAVLKVLRK